MTTLDAFYVFRRAQRESVVTCPWTYGGCDMKHLNHSVSVTMLLMCYTSTEILGFFELMTLISCSKVFQRVYPKQLNPPTSQQLCLLCRTSWRTNPWANFRSGNIGLDVHRQRECPKLGIAVKMHVNTGERLLRFAITCATNIFKCTVLNFAAWTCYPYNLCRNHQEKRRWVAKTNASKLLICRLENSRFHFSICYAKQLITWQNLASGGNRKWQRWLWSDFRMEFPLYVHGFSPWCLDMTRFSARSPPLITNTLRSDPSYF